MVKKQGVIEKDSKASHSIMFTSVEQFVSKKNLDDLEIWLRVMPH